MSFYFSEAKIDRSVRGLFCLMLVLFLLIRCGNKNNEEPDLLFQLIPSDSSQINFINEISTNDNVNILTYEYLYNGGGVAVGDFNNDGLVDLFFGGNQVPCKLYINTGNFKFSDYTAHSGIDTNGIWAYGLAVVDINQDGFLDIYISAGGIGNRDIFPNQLYINQGDLTFKEEAIAYGLADAGESMQALFFDYDRDNDLDLYLLTGGGFEKSAVIARPVVKDGSARNTDRLYRNDFDETLGHAVYTNVSTQAGIAEEGFGLGVALTDANEDGWPDIYVTNDYLSHDLLYINNQNGTFTDHANEYLKHTSHFAMGNDAGDINNDGALDLVSVDMLPENYYRRKLMFGPNQYDRFYTAVQFGYGYQYMRNTLQLNQGAGSFSEIGQLAGVDKTDWSWAPLLADFDLDGFVDLYITNGYGKDVTDLDFVKFRSENLSMLNRDMQRVVMIDSLANRPEVKIPNYMYKNNGDLTFKQVAAEWGLDQPSLSNGAAYADLDNDGDLDLIVNTLQSGPLLYRNTKVEKDTTDSSNYLIVELDGPSGNRSGIGSLVSLHSGQHRQIRIHSSVHGYLSSMENDLHFGLGNIRLVDTITVVWPDGKMTSAVSVKTNQKIQLRYEDSKPQLKLKSNPKSYLGHLTDVISYKHQENEFNDFNQQPLLLHKFSTFGPSLAVGDINGDGLEDVFIGAAYRHPRYVHIQQQDGSFKQLPFPMGESEASEDAGSLMFDADSDGDLDIYVVSGGNEYYDGHERYQDRLYVNDGQGNFRHAVDALPLMLTSGSCVVAADYDGDLDLDLFVGGRIVPAAFPKAPRSYLLQNTNGSFKDVTATAAPGLMNIGMVTSALWTDINADRKPDLIIAGEGMPIEIWINQKAKFQRQTEAYGLADSHGFWNCLQAGDFDGDGDLDYVAGNLGLNTSYRASADEPFTVFYADFDGNGSVDPLMGYFEQGNLYPLTSLDALTQQLPKLKKEMLYYRRFARTTLPELVTLLSDIPCDTLQIKTLTSAIIINNGNQQFDMKPLPALAQVAPIQAFHIEDINNDGLPDILAVGNHYDTEVVMGRYDAMKGVVLISSNSLSFTSVNAHAAGFVVDGDARSIAKVKRGTHPSIIIVTQNNDFVKVFQILAHKSVMPDR